MTEQKQDIVQVNGSNGLKAQLNDKNLPIAIDAAKPYLDLIFQQMQRDVINENEDHEDGWAIVKALDKIHDRVLLYSTQGQKDRAQETADAEKSQPKTR